MFNNRLRCSGFSLIEMLVVISIIAVLAGLVVTAMPLVRAAAKQNQTKSIIGILHQSLGLHAVERGAAPAPAEHPIAWSVQPRLAFAGFRGRTIDANGVIDSSAGSWSVLSATGEAIGGLKDYEIETNAAKYPSGSDSRLTILSRLIDPDDIFLGSAAPGVIDAPAYVGVPRRWLGLLAAPLGDQAKPTGPVPSSDGKLRHLYPVPTWGTRWRKIPAPRSPVTSANLAPPPYDYRAYAGAWSSSWKYDDLNHVQQGWNDPGATQKLIDWLMGGSGLLEELRSLKAVIKPDDDIQLTSGSRFWSADAGKSEYEPGRIRPTFDGTGPWRICRPRHTFFVDAWGSEILYYTEKNGNPVFLSAGRDRCFRITPGKNMVVDSDPGGMPFLTSGALTGDDTDGAKDNVRIGQASP